LNAIFFGRESKRLTIDTTFLVQHTTTDGRLSALSAPERQAENAKSKRLAVILE
jgi:hypothetical protein